MISSPLVLSAGFVNQQSQIGKELFDTLLRPGKTVEDTCECAPSRSAVSKVRRQHAFPRNLLQGAPVAIDTKL
jgi:hypothetical protein